MDARWRTAQAAVVVQTVSESCFGRDVKCIDCYVVYQGLLLLVAQHCLLQSQHMVAVIPKNPAIIHNTA